MNLLRTLLRRQDGIAMPTAIGILGITTILAGGVFTVAVDGNSAASTDRDTKRAFAAAQAGAQMGYLHLTQLQPLPEQCIRNGAAGSDCTFSDPPSELGNGASYRYAVGAAGAGANDCAAVPDPTAVTATERCITAIGTVNGVSRRVQTRVTFVPPHKPFHDAGLVARKAVDSYNNPDLFTDIGANERIYLAAHSGGADGTLRPADGAYVFYHREPEGGVQWRPTPWEFPPVDAIFAGTETANDNSRVSSPPYAASGRRFATSGRTGPITLGAGTYNFCSFELANRTEVRVPAGQIVRLLIDSPSRPGSGCPADSGTFRMGNNANLNVDFGQNAAQLQVYVYGRPDAPESDTTPDVTIENGSTMYGTIYGPNANILLRNGGASFNGGVVGKNVRTENDFRFVWPDSIRDLTLAGTGTTGTRGWFECPARPTDPGDPESGCVGGG